MRVCFTLVLLLFYSLVLMSHVLFLPSSDSNRFHLCITNLPCAAYLMCSLLPHLSSHTLFLRLCVLPPSMSSVTCLLYKIKSAVCFSSLICFLLGLLHKHSRFIIKLVVVSLNDQSVKSEFHSCVLVDISSIVTIILSDLKILAGHFIFTQYNMMLLDTHYFSTL